MRNCISYCSTSTYVTFLAGLRRKLHNPPLHVRIRFRRGARRVLRSPHNFPHEAESCVVPPRSVQPLFPYRRRSSRPPRDRRGRGVELPGADHAKRRGCNPRAGSDYYLARYSRRSDPRGRVASRLFPLPPVGNRDPRQKRLRSTQESSLAEAAAFVESAQ